MGVICFAKALFETWWARLWVALAALSTIATFASLYAPGFTIPRWIPPSIAIVAWVIAPYRLYTTQQNKIAVLQQRLDNQERDAERVIKREWKPKAWIESEPPQNYLCLKADREFVVDTISVKFSNGAVAFTFNANRDCLCSTGFRLPIPNDKIAVGFWNNSGGPRNGSATGSIEAIVLLKDYSVAVEVPFMARQEFSPTPGTASPTAWIYLQG